MAISKDVLSTMQFEAFRFKCKHIESCLRKGEVEKYVEAFKNYNAPSDTRDSISVTRDKILIAQRPEDSRFQSAFEGLNKSSKMWLLYFSLFQKLKQKVSTINEAKLDRYKIHEIRTLYLSLYSLKADEESYRAFLDDRICKLSKTLPDNFQFVFFDSVVKHFETDLATLLNKTCQSLDVITTRFFASNKRHQIKARFPYSGDRETLLEFYAERFWKLQVEELVYKAFSKCFPESLTLMNKTVEHILKGDYGVEIKTLLNDADTKILSREFLIKIVLIHYFAKRDGTGEDLHPKLKDEIVFEEARSQCQSATSTISLEINHLIKSQKLSLEKLLEGLFSETTQKACSSNIKTMLERLTALTGRVGFCFNKPVEIEQRQIQARECFDTCFMSFLLTRKYDVHEQNTFISNTLISKVIADKVHSKEEKLSQLEENFGLIVFEEQDSNLNKKLLAFFVELITQGFAGKIPTFLNKIPERMSLAFFKPVIEVLHYGSASAQEMSRLFENVTSSKHKVELIHNYISVQIEQDSKNLSHVLFLVYQLDKDEQDLLNWNQFWRFVDGGSQIGKLDLVEQQKLVDICLHKKNYAVLKQILETTEYVIPFDKEENSRYFSCPHFEGAVRVLINKQVEKQALSSGELYTLVDFLVPKESSLWNKLQALVMNFAISGPNCPSCANFAFDHLKGDLGNRLLNADGLLGFHYAMATVVMASICHRDSFEEIQTALSYFRERMQRFDEDEDDYEVSFGALEDLEGLVKKSSEIKKLLASDTPEIKLFETKLEGEKKYSWIYYISLFLYRKSQLQNKELLRRCLETYPDESRWYELTKWLLEDNGDGLLKLIG